MTRGAIGLIWAQAANGVIGRDGTLPWRLPEDQAHFRTTTGGATVVMGRRTWDSLPSRFRPLPGRTNVVLTRQPDWSAPGAVVTGSLREAFAGAQGDVWVIGGAEVYLAALPLADRLVVTELAEPFAGDVHAPGIPDGWRMSTEGWQASTTGLSYRIVTYTRPG